LLLIFVVFYQLGLVYDFLLGGFILRLFLLYFFFNTILLNLFSLFIYFLFLHFLLIIFISLKNLWIDVITLDLFWMLRIMNRWNEGTFFEIRKLFLNLIRIERWFCFDIVNFFVHWFEVEIMIDGEIEVFLFFVWLSGYWKISDRFPLI